MNISQKKTVLSPVTPNLTAADEVEQKLILAIGLEELRSGERITESKLGELLNVSRVPVREAMQRLLTFGVLQLSGGRGMCVSDYGKRRVKDLMELRLAIERIHLNRVMTDTETKVGLVGALQSTVDRMTGLSSVVDGIELSRMDLEFHGTIAEYSNNDLAAKAWNVLAPHLMIVFCRDWSIFSKRAGEVQDHQHLLEFIRDGDPKDIDAELRHHFPKII